MAVRIAEIKAAAAVAMVDRHVLMRARSAAVGDALFENPVVDPVELGLADLERVMMPLELFLIVEVDGQLLVDPDRREVRDWAGIFKTKDPGEKPGGCFLVVGGHNGVIEMDRHGVLPRSVSIKMSLVAAVGKLRALSPDHERKP
jgi:hypothetical protein